MRPPFRFTRTVKYQIWVRLAAKLRSVASLELQVLELARLLQKGFSSPGSQVLLVQLGPWRVAVWQVGHKLRSRERAFRRAPRLVRLLVAWHVWLDSKCRGQLPELARPCGKEQTLARPLQGRLRPDFDKAEP